MDVEEVISSLREIRDYIEIHKLDPSPEGYEELGNQVADLIEELEDTE